MIVSMTRTHDCNSIILCRTGTTGRYCAFKWPLLFAHWQKPVAVPAFAQVAEAKGELMQQCWEAVMVVSSMCDGAAEESRAC